MGCDIHLFTEKKVNGKWADQNTDLEVDRNYDLFSILADVRNYNNIVPISEPKGIPADADEPFKKESDRMDDDGHSHSYLTLQELLDYLPNVSDKQSGMISAEQAERLEAGELPTSWSRSTSTPGYVYREWQSRDESLQDVVNKLNDLKGDLPETDIRIVFFFDN